jgi:hypothetical protein
MLHDLNYLEAFNGKVRIIDLMEERRLNEMCKKWR